MKELEEAQAKVADLEKQLRNMGVDIQDRDKKLGALSASLEEQARALDEYKARAHQLELIKERFEKLKAQARRAHEARPRGERPPQPDGDLAAGRRALRLRQARP